jgi:DNA-binding transcriptional LysR family regulator
MLDWDDLRFFLALARNGTLTAAARSLEVTQPTVGRRIAAFERRLGAKLFTPTPSGHVLSSTGRTLFEHATRMESEALSAERLARGRDTGLRGRVTITGSEWIVERLLDPMVGPLAARHPGLEIELLADPRPLNLVRRGPTSRSAHRGSSTRTWWRSRPPWSPSACTPPRATSRSAACPTSRASARGTPSSP